jgi:hypothetical protein
MLKLINRRDAETKSIIALLFICAQVSGSMILVTGNPKAFDSTGYMPEVLVTAPRYENEDDAWSGMMEEIVVTAPRYHAEDVNFVGIMTKLTSDQMPGNSIFLIMINLITAVILILLFHHKYHKPAREVCQCEK